MLMTQYMTTIDEPDDVLDHLIDWRREAKEEIKTLRFCPQCGNLVKLKLQEHKHFRNWYGCPLCGELVLSKITVSSPLTNRGYSKERYSK